MLIDSHLHLTDEAFKNKEENTVLEAKNVGVEKFVTIGTSISDNNAVIKLVKLLPDVYGTVGVYPHENLDMSPIEIEKKLREQVDNQKIVGIGECGIDKADFEKTRSIKEQRKIFRLQVELALEKNLPLVVHNREGDEEILYILNEYKEQPLRGIVHCFVSSWETAKKFLNLNFMISFSGIITYPSGKKILETVKNVPNDRFIVETDAPYLAPQGHRGEVNAPKYVRITAQKVAETKAISMLDVEKYSYNNTSSIFGI